MSRGGKVGQECVNPYSHLVEQLLLLSQEAGHTWPRYLGHRFSQYDQQGSSGVSTNRFSHPLVWLRLKPMILGL